jgi:hypothetical protein
MLPPKWLQGFDLRDIITGFVTEVKNLAPARLAATPRTAVYLLQSLSGGLLESIFLGFNRHQADWDKLRGVVRAH